MFLRVQTPKYNKLFDIVLFYFLQENFYFLLCKVNHEALKHKFIIFQLLLLPFYLTKIFLLRFSEKNKYLH